MKIIVTGGARGLGFEIAQLFATEDGHDVAVIDVAERPLQLDHKVTYIPQDLLSDNYSPISELLDDWQRVDILVNNAGLVIVKPFMKISDNDWSRLIGVNFLASVKLIRLCLPFMISERVDYSHIVNISSMGGFQGSVKFPGLSGYSAGKSALANLTESLVIEYQDLPIRINCLCPGAIDTEMFREAFPQYSTNMSPAKMAEFVCDFALNGKEFYNGKILPVSLSTP